MPVTWMPKCSPLFVDKLSMTLYVSDDEKMIVLKNFIEVVDQSYGGKLWESTNYNFSKKIYVDGEYILFQCEPKQAGSNWLRVEYNPSKVSPSEVAGIVNLILPGGYNDLIAYGRITRIDFATNCKYLPVGNLFFQYPNMSISRNHLKSGAIQAAYLGGDEGVNQFVLYDKVAEIKSKNNKLGKSFKKEMPLTPTTRIEWRYRPKEICTFKKIQSATSNAFENLSLAVITGQPKIPTDVKEGLVRLVFELSKYTGLQQALLAAPKQNRDELKCIILNSGNSGWWKPLDLWKTLPGALKDIISPELSKYVPKIEVKKTHET